MLPKEYVPASHRRRPHLGLRASDAVATAGTELPLASLWWELAAGRQRAVDWFCEGGRCFLVTTAGAATKPSILQPRNLDILRGVLLGRPQKVIALELGVSQSTVNIIASQVASAMGFETPARAFPAMLFMTAYAATHRCDKLARRASVESDGGTFSVMIAEGPNVSELTSLSEAEREIVGLLVERLSNAEIARIRGTSSRTVANQLGSVIRKLNVPGRGGVLSKLLETGVRSCAALTPPLEPRDDAPAARPESWPQHFARSTLGPWHKHARCVGISSPSARSTSASS